MNYFVLLFIIFPILEIAILIKVGSRIGVLNTVLIVVLTGIIGAVMARIQGFIILQKISDTLNRGLMPSMEILDGALVLAGGICLLDPGFIGDVLGFILLVPWTRALVRSILTVIIKRKLDKGEVITITSIRSYKDDDRLSR